MPELAEVETTRRDLTNIIKGKRINKVSVYLDKIVYNKKDLFIETIEGQSVKDVKRRGKWLIFELDNNYLIIHFRMEGRFYHLPLNEKKDKHDYVIFDFDDFSLHYNDPRLFGKMQVITKDKIKILSEYKPSDNLNSITLVKNHEEANTYSQKVKDKVDQIYSKLTRRCGQHKIDYINKYSFTEIPIESKNDLYPLVSKYKRVKVYFEPGDKRGTKKLYALVKN